MHSKFNVDLTEVLTTVVTCATHCSDHLHLRALSLKFIVKLNARRLRDKANEPRHGERSRSHALRCAPQLSAARYCGIEHDRNPNLLYPSVKICRSAPCKVSGCTSETLRLSCCLPLPSTTACNARDPSLFGSLGGCSPHVQH